MNKKVKTENLFQWLKIGTIIWLIFTLIVALWTISPTKYDGIRNFFEQMKFENFNNWGDFFAGFFAPLAFLWLGFGVLIQRDEFGKLAESVDAQKAEMETQSEQFRTQTGHMAKQISLIMSQDLANLYGKYSSNMSSLYDIDLNDLDTNFSSMSKYRLTVEKFESLENILSYNYQIERYFFSEDKIEMQEIINMLRIDYNVMHRKKINITKKLYIKIAILKLLQYKYPSLDIKLPETIHIDNFISESLKEKVSTLISNSSKTTPEDIAMIVFDNITTDEEQILKYIEVK